MKELLTAIIENLVTDKASVLITETVSDGDSIFEVKVAESDMGKIIGKEGRIAKSIRIVMKSIAAEEKKNISIEFIG